MKINPLTQMPRLAITSSSNNQTEEKYSTYLVRIAANTANNLSKIAIPVIAVASLASMPSADAGPAAYAACLAGCAATGVFAPICVGLCAPLLAAPSL